MQAGLLMIPGLWTQFREFLADALAQREVTHHNRLRRILQQGTVTTSKENRAGTFLPDVGFRKASLAPHTNHLPGLTSQVESQSGTLRLKKHTERPPLARSAEPRSAAGVVSSSSPQRETASNLRGIPTENVPPLRPLVGPTKPANSVSEEAVKLTATPTPPHHLTFKPVGYVEKTNGQLEAVILQDDHALVVHMGEVIGDKYRVVKISADSVEAVEETMERVAPQDSRVEFAASGETSHPARELQSPARPATLASLPGPGKAADDSHESKPLGYVERKGGRVDFVMAEGEHVRLVPKDPVVSLAQWQGTAHVVDRLEKTRGSANQAPPPSVISPPLAAATVAEPVHVQRSLAGLEPPAAPPAVTLRKLSSDPLEVVTRLTTTSLSLVKTKGPGIQPEVGIPGKAQPAAWTGGEASAGPARRQPTETARIIMKPIGFVKRADGELAAVLAEGDAVYVVKAGDHFAWRYRALRVSPEAVEVVEDWKDSVPLSHGRPKLELTANNQSRSLPGTSSAAANLSYPATYVFQTLGYVEALTGELEAVVADGEKVYLIKQGERFGDDYRAISVDPSLVLAVRASPGWDVEKLLARQSDFRQEPASKLSYGTLHSSTSAKVELCASREAVAHVAPHLEDLGVDLINIPGLAGLDSQ